jgi:N-methylhydantoinase A
MVTTLAKSDLATDLQHLNLDMARNSPAAMPLCRVGADIGGTFTDIALDIGGQLFSTKLLTDYGAPETAIIKGIASIVESAAIAPSDIDVVIHGTTLATNALIQRRGAKTAFVTTEGFRDVLEMGTESRFEQYDLNISLSPPLIERRHRYTVRERMSAAGTVLLPLDPALLIPLSEIIASRKYESIAIGFIHGYANPDHERKVRDVFEQLVPGVPISIASETSPQMREFERFNTVCANAYVKPLIKSYLNRLVESLRQIGVVAPVFMMHSGGGLISVESAAESPVRLVESGPAGGAIFAADLARRYRLDSVLSFDMGGTTAKICLIENQTPKTANTFEVARTYRFRKGSGMPISIPVVEMVEIGAGGGSIASTDVLRQIRVGPYSAGSEPGPACYQRGGTMPTVTDADLLLGKIDADNFAGGSIPLSVGAAEMALSREIGSKLSMARGADAYGVCEVVDENMANAARIHAIECGKTITDFTMITFGGAGPLHAARLCEKLGISAFLVPLGAGVGSAIGFLRAPFGYEAVRSAVVRLASWQPVFVDSLLASMTEEALRFVLKGLDSGQPTITRTAFMRYAGQGWEIPVPLPLATFCGSDAPDLQSLFAAAYARFFGRPNDGVGVEVVSWSVKASSRLPSVTPVERVTSRRAIQPQTRRPVFDAARREFVDAGIYDRNALTTGDLVEGPAVIVEAETSTVITTAFVATVQPDGCLLVAKR